LWVSLYKNPGSDFYQIAKYPDVPIYGGSEAVLALTHLVKDKDEFKIGDDINVRCLATPCHTQDSICYYVADSKKPSEKAVFTGDTLFQAGCGRFFEGNGEQMHKVKLSLYLFIYF
jgi:hydroxyacylglutathione hydrolase